MWICTVFRGLRAWSRRGRLRWFGHVERNSGDDWVLACRNVVVAGVRSLRDVQILINTQLFMLYV